MAQGLEKILNQALSSIRCSNCQRTEDLLYIKAQKKVFCPACQHSKFSLKTIFSVKNYSKLFQQLTATKVRHITQLANSFNQYIIQKLIDKAITFLQQQKEEFESQLKTMISQKKSQQIIELLMKKNSKQKKNLQQLESFISNLLNQTRQSICSQLDKGLFKTQVKLGRIKSPDNRLFKKVQRNCFIDTSFYDNQNSQEDKSRIQGQQKVQNIVTPSKRNASFGLLRNGSFILPRHRKCLPNIHR